MPDSDPESGLGPLASLVSRSKRVKVEIVNTDGTASFGGGVEDLPGLATRMPMGKGKAARRPPARTPSSQSAAKPKKPKTINHALEKPHPAPAHWRETYDIIKEIRCDTDKWKEVDPSVLLWGTLSLVALLAAEEQAIADAIGKVGFWRRKTQFVRRNDD